MSKKTYSKAEWMEAWITACHNYGCVIRDIDPHPMQQQGALSYVGILHRVGCPRCEQKVEVVE